MTTWLEFRGEPLSDLPEVMIREHAGGKDNESLDIICNSEHCIDYMVDWTFDQDEAEEIKLQHLKWHEEGMPQ